MIGNHNRLADENLEAQLELARMTARRLERISVDSIWARRSSGARGNLLKQIETLENFAAATAERPEETLRKELEKLNRVLQASFAMLEEAARQIPDDDRQTNGGHD